MCLALFYCREKKLLQHGDISDAMVASCVIHAYILGNGRNIIRRMALGLHVEESELLMAMTEHAVPFLVRSCKPSLNTKEFALVRVYDEQAIGRNVGPSQVGCTCVVDGFEIRQFELLRLRIQLLNLLRGYLWIWNQI